MERKFRNSIKELQMKHNHAVVQLDHQHSKMISHRPRYSSDSSALLKSTLVGDKSTMSSTAAARKGLTSAKGGRRV